ncbi:MAG: pyridoxamine 5'-phosphate oxidase [Gammaproteobacteria bacterium]|nr:pyridoxamine 5'-phosphate oxidase [Gammaproteobacteria bacterium]
MSKDLHAERRDYGALSLSRSDLKANPHELFDDWMNMAFEAGIIDTTAMTLATVTPDGWPQARVVLLKEFSDQGFVWFTNKHSPKGEELAHTPKACLLFYWRQLERQVRITGTVSDIEDAESAKYFHSRPEESRFSAAASEQSRPVANRQVLEDKVQALHKQFPDGQVPCPPHWGGYLLKAENFEFWQGRASRLHDRFRYLRQADGSWQIDRLSP